MPNFWSRGKEYLEEKFGAKITKDKDFESILKKMEKTEKGLNSLRSVLKNFNLYKEKFCSFFVDLNNVLNLIYDNCPYYLFIEQFVGKQQIINTHFEYLNKSLLKLYSRTSEWDRIFELAKNQMIKREEKRKIYDHYEKKLLNIEKTSKNIKYIERNEEKYTKAASDYVEISEKLYNIMQDSLKLSWKLTNPIVSELIIEEQNLFERISSSLSCFKDNIKRFSEIEYSLNNPNSKVKNTNYDPLKYMKEKDLIKKISAKRNTKIIELQIKDAKQREYFIWGSKKGNITKKEEKSIGNINNILSNSRLTNSFGNLPEKKLEDFYDIKDDFD